MHREHHRPPTGLDTQHGVGQQIPGHGLHCVLHHKTAIQMLPFPMVRVARHPRELDRRAHLPPRRHPVDHLRRGVEQPALGREPDHEIAAPLRELHGADGDDLPRVVHGLNGRMIGRPPERRHLGVRPSVGLDGPRRRLGGHHHPRVLEHLRHKLLGPHPEAAPEHRVLADDVLRAALRDLLEGLLEDHRRHLAIDRLALPKLLQHPLGAGPPREHPRFDGGEVGTEECLARPGDNHGPEHGRYHRHHAGPL